MNDQPQTLTQALLAAMIRYGQRPAFKVKRGRHYETVSYREFQNLTFRLVRFFFRSGLTPGMRLALVATNSLEWLAAYMAGLVSGCGVVPLHITNVPADLHFVLKDSGCRLAILQDADHLRYIMASMTATANNYLPDLKTIFVINNREAPAGVTTIESLLAEPALDESEEAMIRSHAAKLLPADLAAIYYVTGRHGYPRGAVFDQARCLATMKHMANWFSLETDDVAFTFRPWSEIASLWATLHYFLSGVANALIASYENWAENMQQTSPTVMLSMPNTFERYYEDKMKWIAQQPEANQRVFQWALKRGKEYRTAAGQLSPTLVEEYVRADLTFFSQFRGELGGRFRCVYSAMGPLPREVTEFFEAIGLPILNLYSQVEAGGFPAASTLTGRRQGACGQVGPGFAVRIADDGEILLAGETVMKGYWRCPEETAEAFTDDDWLRSGDRGYLDADGYLHITGRTGHLIVLSSGRRIAPLAIENALTASPFITQAALMGEGKPHLSAMLVLDLPALADHFKDVRDQSGQAINATSHPLVKALFKEIIETVNRDLDVSERIVAFSLLDQPFRRDTGELTPSLKISRHVVAERYAEQIEAMYPLPPQIEAAEVSQVQVEPERLRTLIHKESILDAWMADAGLGFLFNLARQKKIDASSMVHICDAATTIAQMENEEKPLSTAFIVGDLAKISRVLPESQIRLRYADRIGRMRKNLVAMARMVDGRVRGYVVDKHGYVRGVYRLPEVTPQRSITFLGPQFQRHAAISEACEAVVFFVPAGGRQVRVFADGQLIGRYSNGDWSPENMRQIDEVVAALALERHYNLGLVRRVLGCAFQMSEENLGAIFIVGAADLVLERSDTSEINYFATIIRTNLQDLTDAELINFAQQDGATIIDGNGEFRGCMVLLRPDADTQAEIGPGKGARHSSAAKMSAETKCLAITVSQDGPITIYESGRRILSL
jgi:long-chain acyl-CoA synthetase